MLLDQLQKNLLAMISLVVALSALGYNTWRNELTEHNRNTRMAGFELLVHISELQRITYLAHYDKDLVSGNPRKGWSEVLVIQDLGKLIGLDQQLPTGALLQAWQDHWEGLGNNPQSVSEIDDAINQLRQATLSALRSLE